MNRFCVRVLHYLEYSITVFEYSKLVRDIFRTLLCYRQYTASLNCQSETHMAQCIVVRISEWLSLSFGRVGLLVINLRTVTAGNRR